MKAIDSLDWPSIEADLDQNGWALIRQLLTPAECTGLAALYGQPDRFRSRVVMARHGYGQGEYQYFDYPLPPLVAGLRSVLYPRLAPLANLWHERLGLDGDFPAEHSGFLQRCHDAGQSRPTPLLLRYVAGDYNCLHQDLYGEQVFPMQLAVLLSEPGKAFEGGEFVITEQRPRMQSRVQVVPLSLGDGVLLAVNFRPAPGVRGYHRVRLRHGVSQVRSGLRHTLGVIFHDAL
ncbi:proline hydroxylase [Pseudomonas taiwanensis]|uniref:2OG-Fe(II) oxygenase n=1 Tax=Pseudomonas taiwanensis TaxID=470150 RepID=UPI0015C0C595|nr:2OG-Fe(II) oxygenase [Pseudomonas taiwanensis]NWL78712.1 proline hydroxylase [Pseudomonas taiwanensis]